MGFSTSFAAARSGLFRTLGLMFISGFCATVAFDLWGQVVSPGLGFATLSPHGLAKSLLGAYGLPNGDFAGYFVHFYLVGLIGYPVGWLYVFRPVWSRLVRRGGWFWPRPRSTASGCGSSPSAASRRWRGCRSS